MGWVRGWAVGWVGVRCGLVQGWAGGGVGGTLGRRQRHVGGQWVIGGGIGGGVGLEKWGFVDGEAAVLIAITQSMQTTHLFAHLFAQILRRSNAAMTAEIAEITRIQDDIRLRCLIPIITTTTITPTIPRQPSRLPQQAPPLPPPLPPPQFGSRPSDDPG